MKWLNVKSAYAYNRTFKGASYFGLHTGVGGGGKVLRNVSIQDYCIRPKFTHNSIAWHAGKIMIQLSGSKLTINSLHYKNANHKLEATNDLLTLTQ